MDIGGGSRKGGDSDGGSRLITNQLRTTFDMQRIDSSKQNPDSLVKVGHLFGTDEDPLSMDGKVCVLLGSDLKFSMGNQIECLCGRRWHSWFSFVEGTVGIDR